MSNKSILVVLALLALAAAGWFVLGGGDAALQPTAPAGAAGPVDAAHGELAPAGAPAAPAPPGATPDAATAARRTAVETPAPGAGADGDAATLRGRIVDHGGNPRAGVELAIRSWVLPGEFEAIPLPANPDAPRRGDTVRTDRDGRFTFRVARDRAGSLELLADELVFARDDVVFDMRKGDVDLGDVRALAASTIRGIVRDANGRGVADVKVAVFHDGMAIGRRSESTTGADGRFTIGRLNPGKWLLRTASSRYLPASLAVELLPEEQKENVELRVEQGSAVAGVVVDDRGAPVAGMHVGSKRKEARDGATFERFTPGEATTTDANGYFTLAGLDGATVTLRVYGDGHAPRVEPAVAVGTGNLVLRVDRVGRIAGVLRDATGQPVAGSTVRAVGARGHDELGLGGELHLLGMRDGATTAADGSYTIENVAPGTVRVEAEGAQHRPVSRGGVQVLAGQTTTGIDLVADRGATLRARVVDENGQAVAGAEVTVRSPRRGEDQGGAEGPFAAGRRVRVGAGRTGDAVVFGGEEDALGNGTTGEDGRVVIAGLPAGVVAATATHDDHAPSRAAEATLSAAAGADVELVLRRPGHAELRTLGSDGTPGAARWVVRGPLGPGESNEQRSGETGADGTARLTPLAPGEYAAELRHEPRPQSMGGAMFVGDADRDVAGTRVPFTVRSGATTAVELRMPVLTRVVGTVTDAAGPAAGIEVELEQTGEDAPPAGPMFGGLKATTGPDGAFAIDGVEAGAYRIRWGKKSQVVKAAAELLVPPNQPELRRDLELRYGKVEVQVVDQETGRGIAGAEVTLVEGGPQQPRTERRVMMVSIAVNAGGPGGPESTTMTMESPRATTGADGRATIEDVPPGTWNLGVHHDAYAPGTLKDQVVGEGRTTDCGRMELGAAGRIRGSVLGADGQPAGLALVLCRRVGEPGDANRQPAMGGTFALDGLRPGRYALRAQALAGMPGQAPGGAGPEVEIEVEAGKTAPVELRLPAR